MDSGIPMVQSIFQDGVTKVPPRFVRAEVEASSKAGGEEIPVIDLRELTSKEGVIKLDKACRDWGFFQLVGHDVPQCLMEEAANVVKEFFQLPQTEKDKYSTAKHGASEGYGRYFLPSEETPLDWGDTFYHLLWPKGKMEWPTEPGNYRKTIEAYRQALRDLGTTLLAALSRAIDQPCNFLQDAFGTTVHTLRANFYPPCPEPDLVYGLSPHSDAVGITILLQDCDVQGLEIKKDGKWTPVRPMPGAFVINVGDVIEIMTNGVYKSVEHRAVVNSSKRRVSLASFYSPGRDVVLRPLIGNPPLYKEMTMASFLEAYMSGELTGKGHLQSVRL